MPTMTSFHSLAALAWAWGIEVRCDWRLAKRLDEVPKVIKSS
jgi:hypothetical protein